ncbi:hypothetical protein TNCV_2536461 [Trichonephila clavipes]|nr:hypothetical protein TNCV_2536461 [Trichonephila clavipes]
MPKLGRWRSMVSPSIVPLRNFVELIRSVTCMVLKANDRHTSTPCHDEFRGNRSDYVRQVTLVTTTALSATVRNLLLKHHPTPRTFARLGCRVDVMSRDGL